MAKIATSLAPWLSIRNASRAEAFYRNAFGAIQTYRMETPDGGLVLKLSVDGAEFWVSGQSTDTEDQERGRVGGDSIKIILTVADPDNVYERAINAGATEVFPVGENYGWRLGRVVDPFGLHWEIGKPL
jgi:PhnB protein